MNKKAKVESSNESMFINTWGCAGSSDGQFNVPNSIAVSSNGIIYVSDGDNSRIQCFDPNGTFIYKWGKLGKGDGEFRCATGLAIGLNETKNVIDGEAKSIMNAMHLVPELASFPPGVLPICISYLGMECLYITDSGNDRIQVFDVSSLKFDISSLKFDISSLKPSEHSSDVAKDNVRFIRKWGSRGTDDGQFRRPLACSINMGLIYVTDTYNYRIQVFDTKGKFIYKWGTIGNAIDQFIRPCGIDVSRDGKIYIADEIKDKVVCYEVNNSSVLDGFNFGVKIVNEWKPSIKFSNPSSVMVDDNGMIYIDDYNNRCIRKLRKDGRLVNSFGGYGSIDGQFRHPIPMSKGIDTVGETSLLYVVDRCNDRIVVISV